MRIEIVKDIAPCDRERYEFIVRVDSLAVRAHLASYRREYRESTRHRTWNLTDAWYEDERRQKNLPLDVRMAKQPSVPHWVHRQMLLNLERSHSYNYTVDHGMKADGDGIRN